MATKRQIRIVENFIKKETKRLMKEENKEFDFGTSEFFDQLETAIATLERYKKLTNNPKWVSAFNSIQNTLTDLHNRSGEYSRKYGIVSIK